MTSINVLTARAALAGAQLAQDPRDLDCVNTVRELLLDALAELDRLEVMCVHRVDIRYLSPCQPGYDTVLGYLAKHQPGTLELLDQVPDATIRDGFKLRALAIKRDLPVLKVDASPFLRSFGIEQVNSYPIRILVEHFGL